MADRWNNYRLSKLEHDEAEIGDAMNASHLLSVAVAKNPTDSVTPHRPKPVVDSVPGTIIALFFGSSLMFFPAIRRINYSLCPGHRSDRQSVAL